MNEPLQRQLIVVLSERERAVAERFASGMTYREISEALFIAPSTVRTHLAAIYEKLGVRNKVGLAALFAPASTLDAPPAIADSLPTIAVFPIDCLNSDEQWQRFAHGLSSDIAVDLARYSGLPVIAYHTTKALGSTPETLLANGRSIGASYLLSGQLRADGQRIRLTMQLSDSATGVSLWGERYDRAVEDVFILQDGLTVSIINALGGNDGKLATLGRNAARRKPHANLRAYDLFLLSTERHNELTAEGVTESNRMTKRALELDPTLAAAWTELGFNLSVIASDGHGDEDLETLFREWRYAAERALQLDPSDSIAHQCFGDACAAVGDFDNARLGYQRALEYGMNHADTVALMAGSRALVLGDPAEGIDLIERAHSLNPIRPSWYHGMKGRVLFVNGRYAESIACLMRAPLGSPNLLMFLAMAQAMAGDREKAAQTATRLKSEYPAFTVERFIAGYPVTNPPAREAIEKGAKAAGLV